ncbi:MAG: right-handed parallel beta-helix repeat-containing protein [Planctomycetota bacterium]|nr:right-handed parallel beta-helix repeat-containing protein [Planctomycetota bacterium]
MFRSDFAGCRRLFGSVVTLLVLVVHTLLSPAPVFAAEEGCEILEITQDTKLDPKKTYGSLVIRESNITLDGQGAWLIGPGEDTPKSFVGRAIIAEGVHNVTISNVNAKGWETGLILRNCQECVVEGCDFSKNFHDPGFGWGENGRRGGILLERVSKSTLKKNRANQVWDGCVLVDSNQNSLEENDFSHTSNTCLKLWHSSDNTFHKNNFSYGIRKDPGEVHARDSTSVLIESGSNDNRFTKNDCTHGGDGIFIRVLNGWVSTGNVFEDNDCSYANNNCVEAWSPRNTYIRNKANHGSYGFWLGASDQTVLIDNEASFNGLADGNHNSPHLPQNGHAGIVFMFGPSSHTIVRGNRCEGNNGAGIALIGDQGSKGKKWKAFHWIIERNHLEQNRWGIFAQHADWIDLAGNTYVGNADGMFHNAGNVAHVTDHGDDPQVKHPPVAKLVGPTVARVGEPFTLDAGESADAANRTLTYRWDLGDGTFATTARVEHIFSAPGFYRIGLTVNNGTLSDLAWRDFYVVEDLPEQATEDSAERWNWSDPGSKVTFTRDERVKIAGKASLSALAEPYSGGRLNLVYPKTHDAAWSLEGRTHLVFWIRTLNENIPAWQGENPVVTLHESADRSMTLTPKGDFLSSPPYIEAREGWVYFAVPLAGNDEWIRTGDDLRQVNWLSIGVDSWGAPPLRIWLDGLGLKK